jgi:hypothetical protein
MSHNLYVNGFSQAGAEYLAATLNVAYPTQNLVTPEMLTDQFQNSMAYIVHTLSQDPKAVFLIAIREPLECLEAAIMFESEGPKRIPLDISVDMLIKRYNTFHWELLDRDRVVLLPLSRIVNSPNSVLDDLESLIGIDLSERSDISDSEYMTKISAQVAGSWEHNSIINDYGSNNRYIDPISTQLNSKERANRISLLNSLYDLLLSKSIGV